MRGETLQVESDSFLDVRLGLFQRLSLRVASRKRRNRSYVTSAGDLLEEHRVRECPCALPHDSHCRGSQRWWRPARGLPLARCAPRPEQRLHGRPGPASPECRYFISVIPRVHGPAAKPFVLCVDVLALRLLFPSTEGGRFSRDEHLAFGLFGHYVPRRPLVRQFRLQANPRNQLVGQASDSPSCRTS
jgi:hypothetical protein